MQQFLHIWVIWLISISTILISEDILINFWPCSKAFYYRVSVDPESNLVQKVYLNVEYLCHSLK